ncbi:MAG TPA: hypothetical protein VEQ58_17510 [Polyangiaceae bacterium]|nr:hypothetical protein [Polyangiaceae bacterium]
MVGQEVTLTVSGVASAPDVAAIGDSEGGLGVSLAVISSTALRFEPCDDGASDVALAPRSYELLGDPPPSESITTAVQNWCGLRVDVGPATAEVEGVPEGASLYVEASDSDGTPLSFTSDASSTLRFETDAAASFGNQPLLLGIDVSVWLADLPLDPDMSDAAAEQLSSQLQAAARLFVDDNGNGKLDDDETASAIESTP